MAVCIARSATDPLYPAQWAAVLFSALLLFPSSLHAYLLALIVSSLVRVGP